MAAELHVTMEGYSPVVTLTINGQPARLVIDSGASYSLLTPRAAEKFKLRPIALPSDLYLEGIVGMATAKAAEAADVGIDKAMVHKLQFLVAGDSFGDIDGLLGENILGPFDVEYDLADSVVRLFKPDGCDKTMLAYWAIGAGVSVLPIDRTSPLEPNIYGRAKVNDLPIRVAFDTGAGPSLLKLSTALHAGATLQADGASPGGVARGIGRRSTDGYILPFSSFELGSETIKNIRLRVAKADFTGADMLLGDDFFLSHRVLVSPSQHKLYFTYNGGPVFRLDQEGSRSASTPPVEPASDTKTSPPGAPAQALDADAFQRRASVAAARHDYAGAIADLDKAIALAPKDARLFYDRARAKLAAHDAAAAKADLDQALALDPHFAEALAWRGYLYLQQDHPAEADADLDAALTAAPGNPDLEVRIADAYIGARRYDRAVAHLDAWIAAHPASFDLGAALSERCWARALWGRDLDKALADCDRALRQGSRLASALDTRGMVHLRRGEFDQAIADYNEALKRQPKLAFALYGRGLARQKAGDSAGADIDLRTASALDPGIAEQMKAFGITEATVVIAAMH